jgi:hypothetical protein
MNAVVLGRQVEVEVEGHAGPDLAPVPRERRLGHALAALREEDQPAGAGRLAQQHVAGWRRKGDCARLIGLEQVHAALVDPSLDLKAVDGEVDLSPLQRE